jgi:hypothetical protein
MMFSSLWDMNKQGIQILQIMVTITSCDHPAKKTYWTPAIATRRMPTYGEHWHFRGRYHLDHGF